MATKRNPLYIKYEKISRQIRKDISDLFSYNFAEPSTHRHLTQLMDLIYIEFGDLKKILKQIDAEETQKLFDKANRTQLSSGTRQKKITDETPVKLKYKGFDIITYKGRGETWIAQADRTTDGTTFVVYSKPTERKTALEKVQEKIRNYKK